MEDNKRGLVYAFVGVATLVVAIIGATYAYFSVTQQSAEYLYGSAATAGLNVNVYRMTTWSNSEGASIDKDTASYVMVPQLDSTLDQAILGTDITPDDQNTDKTPCIDAGGSLVCSIYRIVVQNTGSAPITVEGSINFFGSTTGTGDKAKDNTTSSKIGNEGDNIMNHLKWARLTQPTSVVDKSYTYADVAVIDGTAGQYHTTMPTTLLTYANVAQTGSQTTGYQITPDGQVYSYQNASTTTNKYLYAMDVTTTSTTVNEVETPHIDLLGGYDDSVSKNYTVTGAHGKYTDLIDPTGDLTVTYNNDATPKKTATAVDNAADKNGKWYLAAKDQAGDTKVFYIVVWISENGERQNDVDHGQFTGTVTFQSSEGSGATSTFTESV